MFFSTILLNVGAKPENSNYYVNKAVIHMLKWAAAFSISLRVFPIPKSDVHMSMFGLVRNLDNFCRLGACGGFLVR